MFDIGVEQTEAGLHLGPVPKFFYQFRLGTGLTRGHELQAQMPGAPGRQGLFQLGPLLLGLMQQGLGLGGQAQAVRFPAGAQLAQQMELRRGLALFQTLGAEITKGRPVGTEAFRNRRGCRTRLHSRRCRYHRGGRSCGPGGFHRCGGRDVVSFDHARFAGPHMLQMLRGLGSGLGGFRG